MNWEPLRQTSSLSSMLDLECDNVSETVLHVLAYQWFQMHVQSNCPKLIVTVCYKQSLNVYLAHINLEGHYTNQQHNINSRSSSVSETTDQWECSNLTEELWNYGNSPRWNLMGSIRKKNSFRVSPNLNLIWPIGKNNIKLNCSFQDLSK